MRKIVRLLFHVVAHLYAAHFKEVALLGLHAHLNLTFAHLTALHSRFALIDAKETEVLRDLEVALRLTGEQEAQPDVAAGDRPDVAVAATEGGDAEGARALNQDDASKSTNFLSRFDIKILVGVKKSLTWCCFILNLNSRMFWPG